MRNEVRRIPKILHGLSQMNSEVMKKPKAQNERQA